MPLWARASVLAIATLAACGPSGGNPAASKDCASNEFTCKDGMCIPQYELCNGSPNCAAGEDEKSCTKACMPGQYQCQDGKCISRNQICNKTFDCASREDEL